MTTRQTTLNGIGFIITLLMIVPVFYGHINWGWIFVPFLTTSMIVALSNVLTEK